MMVIVLKKDLDVKDPDFQLSYCGSPCHSLEEAAEIVYNRRKWICDMSVEFVEGGMDYTEINRETCEIHAIYYVRAIESVRI